MLASQSVGGATPAFQGVGLVNLYQAVLLSEGMLYFSCQRGSQATCDHCHFGQKVAVNVSHADTARPPPAPSPPIPCDALDNCECACCKADSCPGWPGSRYVYTHDWFHADTSEECSPEACAARFENCPAPGSLPAPTNMNSPGRLKATLDLSQSCPHGQG